jgi:hypothetical protein
MKEYWIAFDNGVTGSIGIICSDGQSWFRETPVIKVRDYVKKDRNVHRIDVKALFMYIPKEGVAIIERPMVNIRAFLATESALRSMEATMIALEIIGIPYTFIDSKEWQQEFISSAVIGKEGMKKASKEIAIELFPQHERLITKHGDGDGILMAEFLRRKSNV